MLTGHPLLSFLSSLSFSLFLRTFQAVSYKFSHQNQTSISPLQRMISAFYIAAISAPVYISSCIIPHHFFFLNQYLPFTIIFSSTQAAPLLLLLPLSLFPFWSAPPLSFSPPFFFPLSHIYVPFICSFPSELTITSANLNDLNVIEIFPNYLPKCQNLSEASEIRAKTIYFPRREMKLTLLVNKSVRFFIRLQLVLCSLWQGFKL